MIRLLLVLCPAAAVLSGLGVSYIVDAVIPKASEVKLLINRMLSPDVDFFASPAAAEAKTATGVSSAAEAAAATAETSAAEEDDDKEHSEKRGGKQKSSSPAETPEKKKTLLKVRVAAKVVMLVEIHKCTRC